MNLVQKDIMDRLRQDILLMQGQRPLVGELSGRVKLGPVLEAFPHKVFPIGAVHEYLSFTPADTAATTGFIAGILSGLMQGSGACVWISRQDHLFPPGFTVFGLEPHRILFIHLKRDKDICWATGAALQVSGIAGVVSELPDLDFTASRRLQLAVEKSGATGFILREKPRNINPTACVSRWQIAPAASHSRDGVPGVGVPCWQVDLLKIRGGKPGSWQLKWMDHGFQALTDTSIPITSTPLRKIS
ncbi:MAG: ImuA family protein [Agriterribacter sp.]